MTGATRSPLSVQIPACRAFPPGSIPEVIFPPASSLQARRILGVVEETASVADHRKYPWWSSLITMKDPSPSIIPASHAACVGSIPTRYGRHVPNRVLNPAYVEMANRRIANVAPLFNQEFSK